MNNQTNLTETAIITELQASNKELRSKLQVAYQDLLDVAKHNDSVTTLQISDLRNFLQVLTTTTDSSIKQTVINTMHSILDEMQHDSRLIIEHGFDELKERQKQFTNKLACRCQI